jgi:2-octaprenyl-6-methoxyphenol hydroxylase
MNLKKNASDAIIIGGGPSGLVMAAALGTAGFTVICLERASPRDTAKSAAADRRTTALSYGSAQILKAAGIWARIEKKACPIRDIRVADQDSPAVLDFHHNEIGKDPFGWIVENQTFRVALARRIRALKSVHLVTGAAMKSLATDDRAARVTLEDGRVFTAPLVIGADGRNSASRDAAGIAAYGWNYDQTSIVCTLAHEKPHHHVAVEHFLPGGPLATLPMTKKHSSIVWTETKAAAAHLMKMSDADFARALEEKVAGWLGRIRLEGARTAYPLSLLRAKRLTAKRFALIGDAAHSIHPIAGQGFNLGMGDIGALRDELLRGASLGLDLGDGEIRRAYERRRKFANGNMALMTDVLDRLFSNTIPPIASVRRFGLGAVQRIMPLRRFFMREAMGVRGRKTANKDRKNLVAKPLF